MKNIKGKHFTITSKIEKMLNNKYKVILNVTNSSTTEDFSILLKSFPTKTIINREWNKFLRQLNKEISVEMFYEKLKEYFNKKFIKIDDSPLEMDYDEEDE